MAVLLKLEAVAVEIEYPFAILECTNLHIYSVLYDFLLFLSLNVVTCFLQVSIQGITYMYNPS